MMFKKAIQSSIAFCLLFMAGRIHAQQASQPAFNIVAGSGTESSSANPSVNLPVLGFVVDQSGGLRPVMGIAGSASVGSPLNLGFSVMQAAVPPGHDYILAMTGNSAWPVLLQVRGNTIAVRAMGSSTTRNTASCDQPDGIDNRTRYSCDADTAFDAPAGIDSIAVSPTGSVAGLFSASQGRIYAYGNLSQTPTLLGALDTSAIGNISTFGISDDGNTVLAAGSSPNTGSLYVINVGQQPRLIGSIQHPSAIQFLRNSGNAVVADDADNKVYQLTNGQLVVLASSNDGIATPEGLGISNDNQKIFVANIGSSAVTTLSLNGAAAQSMPCNCALIGIQPTSADSVFAVTAFTGGPISLFDGGSATSRMLFVPVRAQF